MLEEIAAEFVAGKTHSCDKTVFIIFTIVVRTKRIYLTQCITWYTWQELPLVVDCQTSSLFENQFSRLAILALSARALQIRRASDHSFDRLRVLYRHKNTGYCVVYFSGV